jgi:hypothetical protein
LVADTNWQAATAPVGVPEAAAGLSAAELSDGVQISLGVPAGAAEGDTVTLVVQNGPTTTATITRTSPIGTLCRRPARKSRLDC